MGWGGNKDYIPNAYVSAHPEREYICIREMNYCPRYIHACALSAQGYMLWGAYKMTSPVHTDMRCQSAHIYGEGRELFSPIHTHVRIQIACTYAKGI